MICITTCPTNKHILIIAILLNIPQTMFSSKSEAMLVYEINPPISVIKYTNMVEDNILFIRRFEYSRRFTIMKKRDTAINIISGFEYPRKGNIAFFKPS